MISLGNQKTWMKSSYTVTKACVEVRSTEPTSLDLQDSKFYGNGSPVVTVSPEAFAALVAHVRA